MDPVTQMAFGAVIGQAGWRQRFGRMALVGGAVAALLPDLDILIQTGDPFAGWLYHRGVGHSLWGAPVLGLIAGFGFWFYFQRQYKKGNKNLIALAEREALGAWLWLGLLAAVTHIWLDLLTPYGTQLFAPFSNTRFAINAMPIIDLTYTAILCVAIIAGLTLKVPARLAQTIAGVAILASVMWQVFAWDINSRAEKLARQDFDAAAHVVSYPTLLTPYLRRIAVEESSRIYIGFWKGGEGKISWRVHEKQTHPFIEKAKQARAFKILAWFANEQVFWKIYSRPDGSVRIEAHDLRYLSALPDDPPQTPLSSLWGVHQDFDEDGNSLGEPKKWPVFSRSLAFYFRLFEFYVGL